MSSPYVNPTTVSVSPYTSYGPPKLPPAVSPFQNVNTADPIERAYRSVSAGRFK